MPQDLLVTQLTPTVQKHFFEVFEANAENKELSGCIAISENNVTRTYEQFNQEINQLAAYLQSLRCPPATRIGLFFEQSISYVKSVMAIMKVGYCFVPINANEAIDPKKLDKLVEEAEINYIFSHSKFKNHAFIKEQKKKLTITYLDEIALQEYRNSNPNVKVDFEQVAYIHNTSGSTGEPKRMKIAHRGLFNCMDAHIELAGLSRKDTIAAYSALTFDAHICEIMIALGAGAHLRIVPQEDRLNIYRLYNYYCNTQYPITVAIFSPSMLKVLDAKKMLKLRVVLSTGEEVTKAVIDDWYGNKTLDLFINGYGPSEVSIATCMTIMKRGEEPHAGKPIQGLQCWIFNYSENDHYPVSVVATGSEKEGELYISGVGVGLGYIDSTLQNFREILNPITNERMFIFQTRDKAIIRNDGNIILRGRIDRQLKVYGKLVCPEESEAVILNNSKMYGSSAPLLKQVEIDASLTPKKHPNFTAFYMTVDSQDIYLRDLYQNMIGKMPGDVVPARWQRMTAFPRTENGKVDRKALKLNNKGVHIHAAIRWDQHPVPFKEGELEYELLRLFKNALEIEHEEPNDLIAIDDNFLELGGTSLHVTNIVDQIEILKLGSISQKEFYRSPSVAGLSRLIRRKKAELTEVRDLQPFVPMSGKMQGQFPLFLIHSLLGDPVQDYSNFIDGWPNVRPVYCIKARGLADSKDMDDTLEAIASDYVKAITKIQTEGPYLIAGWSTGGMIALAISIELKKQGRESIVVMIDTECHLNYQKQTPAEYANFLSEKLIPLLGDKINLQKRGLLTNTALLLESLPKEEQIKCLFGSLDAKDHVEDKVEEDQNRLTVIGKLLLATLRYKQTRFVENVVLWNARNNDRMGWPKELVEFRTIRQFASDHHAILTDVYAGQLPAVQMETDLSLGLNWIKTRYLIQELKQFYCRKKFVESISYTDNDEPVEKVMLSISEYVKVAEEKHAEFGSIQLDDSKNNTFHDQSRKNFKSKKTFSRVDDLFSDNNKDSSRVFLTADSGFGKTTLCQHIVYRWSQEDLWEEQFDYVFWIPLRNIKDRYDRLRDVDLVEVIRSECFKNRYPLEDIKLLLKGSADRILIIVDGIEEINYPVHDYEFLNQAFQFKHYLVTSQTYSSARIKFDRTYELNGFSDSKIDIYIRQYFSTLPALQKKYAEKLISFIESNGLYDLVRAPIRLSFLCVVWLNKLANDTLAVVNLSSLYDEFIHYILKKYIKLEFGKETSNWSSYQIEGQCTHELEALERIAFETSRSKNPSIVLARTSQLVVSLVEKKYSAVLTDSPLAERFLKRIGLLIQSSEIVGESIQRPHQFKHFTLQAYFSARYIVRAILNKNNDESDYNDAVEFIRIYKYNSYLSTIFKFVSGLLNPAQHNNVSLYVNAQNEFWDLLNDEPVDTSEIMHAQLLISCLDQANFNKHLAEREYTRDYVDKVLKRITSLYSESSSGNTLFPVMTSWFSSQPMFLFSRKQRYIAIVSHQYDAIFHVLQACTSVVVRDLVKKYIAKIYDDITKEMLNGNAYAFLHVNLIVALEGKLSDVSARLTSQLCEKYFRLRQHLDQKLNHSIYSYLSEQCFHQLVRAEVRHDLEEAAAEVEKDEFVNDYIDSLNALEQKDNSGSALVDAETQLSLSRPSRVFDQLVDDYASDNLREVALGALARIDNVELLSDFSLILLRDIVQGNMTFTLASHRSMRDIFQKVSKARQFDAKAILETLTGYNRIEQYMALAKLPFVLEVISICLQHDPKLIPSVIDHMIALINARNHNASNDIYFNYFFNILHLCLQLSLSDEQGRLANIIIKTILPSVSVTRLQHKIFELCGKYGQADIIVSYLLDCIVHNKKRVALSTLIFGNENCLPYINDWELISNKAFSLYLSIEDIHIKSALSYILCHMSRYTNKVTEILLPNAIANGALAVNDAWDIIHGVSLPHNNADNLARLITDKKLRSAYFWPAALMKFSREKGFVLTASSVSNDSMVAALNLNDQEAEELKEYCESHSIFFGCKRGEFHMSLGQGKSTLLPACAIFLTSPIIYLDFMNNNNLPFAYTWLLLTCVAYNYYKSNYSNDLSCSKNRSHFFYDKYKRVSSDSQEKVLIHRIDFSLLHLSVMIFDFAKLSESPAALLISTLLVMLCSSAIYKHRNLNASECAEEVKQSEFAVNFK